jgi:hypothetical protein
VSEEVLAEFAHALLTNEGVRQIVQYLDAARVDLPAVTADEARAILQSQARRPSSHPGTFEPGINLMRKSAMHMLLCQHSAFFLHGSGTRKSDVI